MELTVEIIEQLVKLAVNNKLDKLKLGELEITKTRHDSDKKDSKPANNLPLLTDEDELLYWSTSAPNLTPEQIEALSVNPPPKPKRSKKVKES